MGKAESIVNDANIFEVETMRNLHYPLKLFCRVLTVSLETMKIEHPLTQTTFSQAKKDRPCRRSNKLGFRLD
jgi:hypothetical protein